MKIGAVGPSSMEGTLGSFAIGCLGEQCMYQIGVFHSVHLLLIRIEYERDFRRRCVSVVNNRVEPTLSFCTRAQLIPGYTQTRIVPHVI